MNNYGTKEELKEIIVNLNVSVLHLTNEMEKMQEQIEQYESKKAEKPALLKSTEYNNFIERAIGKMLPPDGTLSLDHDEVMKLEEEFRKGAEWIACIEQEQSQMAHAACTEEGKRIEAQALVESLQNEIAVLKGVIEDRDKEIYDLKEAMLKPADEVRKEDAPTRALTMFKSLPHIDGNKEMVKDWGYTPSLYHFDGKWMVSWVHCEEGDTILDYEGNTPEEAIQNAYDNYGKEVYPKKIVNGEEPQVAYSRIDFADRRSAVEHYNLQHPERMVSDMLKPNALARRFREDGYTLYINNEEVEI